jgi:hypothetical protein
MVNNVNEQSGVAAAAVHLAELRTVTEKSTPAASLPQVRVTLPPERAHEVTEV